MDVCLEVRKAGGKQAEAGVLKQLHKYSRGFHRPCQDGGTPTSAPINVVRVTAHMKTHILRSSDALPGATLNVLYILQKKCTFRAHCSFCQLVWPAIAVFRGFVSRLQEEPHAGLILSRLRTKWATLFVTDALQTTSWNASQLARTRRWSWALSLLSSHRFAQIKNHCKILEEKTQDTHICARMRTRTRAHTQTHTCTQTHTQTHACTRTTSPLQNSVRPHYLRAMATLLKCQRQYGEPACPPPTPQHFSMLEYWFQTLLQRKTEKCLLKQLVRHLGQPVARDFAPAASSAPVPLKAESGLQRLVSSLPEIRSMAQPDNIFIIVTSLLRVLWPGAHGKPAIAGVCRTQEGWKMSACSDDWHHDHSGGICYTFEYSVFIQQPRTVHYSSLGVGKRKRSGSKTTASNTESSATVGDHMRSQQSEGWRDRK